MNMNMQAQSKRAVVLAAGATASALTIGLFVAGPAHATDPAYKDVVEQSTNAAKKAGGVQVVCVYNGDYGDREIFDYTSDFGRTRQRIYMTVGRDVYINDSINTESGTYKPIPGLKATNTAAGYKRAVMKAYGRSSSTYYQATNRRITEEGLRGARTLMEVGDNDGFVFHPAVGPNKAYFETFPNWLEYNRRITSTVDGTGTDMKVSRVRNWVKGFDSKPGDVCTFAYKGVTVAGLGVKPLTRDMVVGTGGYVPIDYAESQDWLDELRTDMYTSFKANPGLSKPAAIRDKNAKVHLNGQWDVTYAKGRGVGTATLKHKLYPITVKVFAPGTYFAGTGGAGRADARMYVGNYEVKA